MLSKLIQFFNDTSVRTENGAMTKATSGNPCLDLFFLAGASRTISEAEIIALFSKAYNYDSAKTIKILFWARDIRWGIGERRFFRLCWNYLIACHPEVCEKIVNHVPFFGRWDDLYETSYHPSVMNTICDAIRTGDALACKWAPRKGPLAVRLTKALNMTPRQYRKWIVANTQVVETLMCEKKWDTIQYNAIPSQAFQKYLKAWKRNDATRFQMFIENVKQGKDTINSSTLFPYQIYQNYKNGVDADIIRGQWKHLPAYHASGSILPVIDVSGSMAGLPMEISVSLGVYLSQNISGPFKNTIISFEGQPQMHTLTGDVIERFIQSEHSALDMSTNLEGVFDVLLKTAKKNRIAQSEMPDMILIISDMEFNYCGQNTNFETIKGKFEKSKYHLPYIVFWNVRGRPQNLPATINDYVGLISGASPSVIKDISAGSFSWPEECMNKILDSERYSVLS